MRRERALKVVLVVVGLLFCAGIYPLTMFFSREPAVPMIMSIYVTLGIFLLLAVPDPAANRSLIAFLAMKVSVNPRSIASLILLRRFVRPRPIALVIPPQSGEGVRESRWRLCRGKRVTEIVQGHFESPLSPPDRLAIAQIVAGTRAPQLLRR